MRSRYLAHAAHLATYTRVRSRARESFFPSLSSSVGSVTQSAREQRWNFEYLESNSLKNPKNFLRTFENRRIYSVAFFIFENCLGTGEWSKVGQIYSLRFRVCSSFLNPARQYLPLARKESVLRSWPRIRYSNTSSRYRNETVARCIDTARSFFQPPHLDYVVRFVAAVKKNSRDDTYIVLRSFDTILAAACYIVALDIDHAEKLQRVKRNLRC